MVNLNTVNGKLSGIWEIIDYKDENNVQSQVFNGIKIELWSYENPSGESTKFDDQFGFVNWYSNSDGSTDFDLFKTNIFQYNPQKRTLHLTGPDDGIEFEYYVDKKPNQTEQEIILRDYQTREFTCKMFKNQIFDLDYNFESLYQRSILSDLKIKASNGKQFNVHRSILWLTFRDNLEPFLNKINVYNFDEATVELILNYCYTNKISNTDSTRSIFTDEEKFNNFLNLIQPMPELTDLIVKLNNQRLILTAKSKIDNLITEIQSLVKYANNIVESTPNEKQVGGIFSDPVCMCKKIKAILEKFIVGFLKLIKINDIFIEIQSFMTPDESVSFIRYFFQKSMLTILQETCYFLTNLNEQFSNLNDDGKMKLNKQLLIEFEFIGLFLKEFNGVASKTIQDLSNEVKREIESKKKFKYDTTEFELTQFQDMLDFVKQFLEEFKFQRDNRSDEDYFESFKSSTDQLTKKKIPEMLENIKPWTNEKDFVEKLDYVLKKNNYHFYEINRASFKINKFVHKLRTNKSLLVNFTQTFYISFGSDEIKNELNDLGLGLDKSVYQTDLDKPAIIQVPRYKSRQLTGDTRSLNANELLNIDEMNDLTLEFNGLKVNVNSAILAARSNYFKQTLTNISDNNKILTVDVGKSEYLPKFIQLLYTGSVENNFEKDSEKDEFLKSIKKYL